MTDRLDWPTELPRTNPGDRTRTSKFDVTLGKAIQRIGTEMDRLEVDDWRLSTGMPQRKTDGLPYASAAEPDDPGVVLRWTMDGDQYAVACDEYTKVRDNMRAVGLYVREKRKMENRPVTTGRSEFTTARLPSADEDTIAGEPPAYAVLGVDPDADRSEIKAAYRERAKTTHPDRGGDEAEFRRVRRAKETLLEGETA